MSNLIDTDELHDDTHNTVTLATDRVLKKLTLAQKKHGLAHGWRYPPADSEVGDGRFFNTPQECVTALRNHLAKGEITDSIAYLMFLMDLEASERSELLVKEFSR